MTNFYELADNNRADLIFTKEQLLAPIQEGMLPAPHPMVAGMEERDYYQGKVTRATDEQEEWSPLAHTSERGPHRHRRRRQRGRRRAGQHRHPWAPRRRRTPAASSRPAR